VKEFLMSRESFPVSPLKTTAILNFFNPDAPEETTAFVTLTGLSWVNENTVAIAGFGGETADHGPDDALVENLSAYVENIVPGVGFDISGYAPLGTFGEYQVWAIVIA
jgi:hypothetical protein